jgi:hypothetical protein
MRLNPLAKGVVFALLAALLASPAFASVITTQGDLFPVPGASLRSQNSVAFNPVSNDLVDPGGNRAVVSLATLPAGGSTVVNLLLDLDSHGSGWTSGKSDLRRLLLRCIQPCQDHRQGNTDTFDTEILQLTLVSPRSDYIYAA